MKTINDGKLPRVMWLDLTTLRAEIKNVPKGKKKLCDLVDFKKIDACTSRRFGTTVPRAEVTVTAFIDSKKLAVCVFDEGSVTHEIIVPVSWLVETTSPAPQVKPRRGNPVSHAGGCAVYG